MGGGGCTALNQQIIVIKAGRAWALEGLEDDTSDDEGWTNSDEENDRPNESLNVDIVSLKNEEKLVSP